MSDPDDVAARSRRYDAYLGAVADQPYRYDFYQVLRRIAAAHPHLPPFGEAARPVDEPVRVAQPAELDFAPASIHAIVRRADTPPRLMQRIFGLLGPHGALPLHLTEYARERARHHNDPTFQRFLDTFTHRFALLFYRAWADAQPVVSLDRADNKAYFNRLGSLVGIGLPTLQDRDELPDSSKVHFAGRLARQTRDAEGLLSWLRIEFGVAAQVQQWCGHWMPLMRAERTRLGRREGALLGRSAVLGATVWDVQHKFRITIGPLTLAEYQRFLPGGRDLVRLQALVRHWVGIEFAWDVKLILRKDEVPLLELGSQAGADDPQPAAEDLVAEGSYEAELSDFRRVAHAGGHRVRVVLRVASGPHRGAELVESAAESVAMHGRIGGLLRALAADAPAIDADATGGGAGAAVRGVGTHAVGAGEAGPPGAGTEGRDILTDGVVAGATAAADAMAHDSAAKGASEDATSTPVSGGIDTTGVAAAPNPESAVEEVPRLVTVAAEGGAAMRGLGAPALASSAFTLATADRLAGRRCRISVRHERTPDGRLRAAIGARAGLGHTTWLGRYLRSTDADDLRIDVERPLAEP